MVRSCTMFELFIIGSGGLGREVLDTVVHLPQYRVAGFIDDSMEIGTVVNGVKVVGSTEDLAKMPGKPNAVLAVGSSVGRKKITEYLGDLVNWCNIVHPYAIVSPYAELGSGILVQAYCILAANSKISNFVLINAHSGVGHDASIGEYASIMSYCDVAGEASLGCECFMGSGSKIQPGITVSAGAYLCAGSVVLRNVKKGDKVIGNPARVVGSI